MRRIKVGAGTLNQTPLDWKNNAQNILGVIQEAQKLSIQVLCLPELCITGYGCDDAFLSPGTWRTATEVLLELVPKTQGIAVSLGLPLFHNKVIYDVCCLVCDGEILGFAAKRALAGDGIHYEPRWFKPWPAGVRSETTVDGRRYPLGDLSFQCADIHIGFEICEDAWIARKTTQALDLSQADIILNPSGSHFAFGKRAIRHRLILEGARTFNASYVYANLLGNEAGRAIYDGDAVVASDGKVLASLKRFSYADWGLVEATVDIDLTRSRSAQLTAYCASPISSPSTLIESNFQFATCEFDGKLYDEAPLSVGEWERTNSTTQESKRCKYEDFTRSVSLALFDYLRKSRAHGFIVSLSGGADSSAVACLLWTMVQLSVKNLGLQGTLDRLAHIPRLGETSSAVDLTGRLITTVYQSTENSSDTTRDAARTLAAALGATHVELDVQPAVDHYTAAVERALHQNLTWQTDDIALQNIQARSRAPGAWLIANLKQALLLSTSNRSETAVGYATMDGDTAGSLSPLAGVDKAFILEWLKWLEHTGPVDVGPQPALCIVTRQVPTAELRPQALAQTDESDLMPYPILDAIERSAIRDRRMPVEVFYVIRAQFPLSTHPDYTVEKIAIWVEKFFRLWCRNQWKRERYAPSFHLDDANLDPKTWCRFPILSGGFERELDELRAKITR